MKVIMLKAVLGWDESAVTRTADDVRSALRAIGVEIVVTEAHRVDTPAASVHNAIVDEIDSAVRQELPTRDDLPVAAPAKEPR